MEKDELKHMLSDKFLSDKRIADLKKKITAMKLEVDEYWETIQYIEKLQQQKKLMKN